MHTRLRIVSIVLLLFGTTAMLIAMSGLSAYQQEHRSFTSWDGVDGVGGHPSLTTVRTGALRFLPVARTGHPWRITRVSRANLAAVMRATGAPVAPHLTGQVYWVEAIGTMTNRTLIALYGRGHLHEQLHQGSIFKGGVVINATTGMLLFTYCMPMRGSA